VGEDGVAARPSPAMELLPGVCHEEFPAKSRVSASTSAVLKASYPCRTISAFSSAMVMMLHSFVTRPVTGVTWYP